MSSNNCKKGGHGDNRLTIVNNSNASIFTLLQYNYPDTSINDESWSYLAYNYLVVESQKTEKLWNSIKWDKVIQNKNEHNMLTVFILDNEIVNNTPWAEIQSNYLILQRYELTIEQLDDMGWRVTYP